MCIQRVTDIRCIRIEQTTKTKYFCSMAKDVLKTSPLGSYRFLSVICTAFEFWYDFTFIE